MRILHTADLHLDRTLFEVRLLDDQVHVLDQIVEIARENRPDVLVIAGDVYDRAQVRGEAIRVFSDFLRRIHELAIAIIITPGNHDAPERIGFAGDILGVAGLHVCGSLRQGMRTVRFTDDHGPVDFHLIPYADPAEGREVFDDPGIVDHDRLMAACLADRLGRYSNARDVVVGHCFVAHGSESESERPLAVGGAGQVARTRFDDADLVLLGHLHRPQPLYSGSILPYSFEEAQDAKSVVLIELGAKGADVRRERIPLEPRRRMRIVEGAMEDLEAGKHGAGDEYVLARLSDQEPVLDAMARLRRLWPNLMHVERQRREASEQNETRTRRRDLDPESLFRAFWTDTTGEEELPDGGDAELKEAVETVRAEDREEDAA